MNYNSDNYKTIQTKHNSDNSHPNPHPSMQYTNQFSQSNRYYRSKNAIKAIKLKQKNDILKLIIASINSFDINNLNNNLYVSYCIIEKQWLKEWIQYVNSDEVENDDENPSSMMHYNNYSNMSESSTIDIIPNWKLLSEEDEKENEEIERKTRHSKRSDYYTCTYKVTKPIDQYLIISLDMWRAFQSWYFGGPPLPRIAACTNSFINYYLLILENIKNVLETNNYDFFNDNSFITSKIEPQFLEEIAENHKRIHIPQELKFKCEETSNLLEDDDDEDDGSMNIGYYNSSYTSSSQGKKPNSPMDLCLYNIEKLDNSPFYPLTLINSQYYSTLSTNNLNSLNSNYSLNSPSNQSVTNHCFLCNKVTKTGCSGCNKAFYCSSQCQTIHWKVHKYECCQTSGTPSSLTPLHVGLDNIGNSCYMNSSLQCLSHIIPLTSYIISKQYKNDLNKTSLDGTGGQLVENYNSLLNELYLKQQDSYNPTKFKKLLGKLNEEYAGMQQQDAHELIEFLLDKLHEDINSVKKKPYVEKIDGDGTNDEEISKKTWKNYLLRENSIINYICGSLMRSKLTCNVCNKVSVSYDYHNTLQVAIPRSINITVPVYLFPPYPSNVQSLAESIQFLRPIKLEFTVDRLCTLNHLVSLVKKHPKYLAITNSSKGLEPVYHLINENTLVSDKNPFLKNLMSSKKYLGVTFYQKDETIKYYYIFLHMQNKESINTQPIPLPILILLNGNTVWCLVKRRIYIHLMKLYSNQNKNIDYISYLEDKKNDFSTVAELRVYNKNDTNSIKLINTTALDKESLANVLHNHFAINKAHDIIFFNVVLENNLFQEINYSLNKLNILQDLHLPHSSDEDGQVQPRQANRSRLESHMFTLHDCLADHTKEEILNEGNEWYCSNCKEFRLANKIMNFCYNYLPDVLILTLKRFEFRQISHDLMRQRSSFNSNTPYMHREKIDTLIDIPIDGLDLKQYCSLVGVVDDDEDDMRKKYTQDLKKSSTVYDLFAVCNHYGLMGFGHYTASARDWNLNDNSLSNQWYSYDDNSKSPIDAKDVITNSAYILFYRRRK